LKGIPDFNRRPDTIKGADVEYLPKGMIGYISLSIQNRVVMKEGVTEDRHRNHLLPTLLTA
jgi:hypothetical protein